MAQSTGPTGISPALKFWILGVLTIVLALAEYFSGHPNLDVPTVIGAVLVAVPLAIQEFEVA